MQIDPRCGSVKYDREELKAIQELLNEKFLEARQNDNVQAKAAIRDISVKLGIALTV
jgi:hypothetical protein